MYARFGANPWLNAKLVRLRRLVAASHKVALQKNSNGRFLFYELKK
jgi:hypothetical protein